EISPTQPDGIRVTLNLSKFQTQENLRSINRACPRSSTINTPAGTGSFPAIPQSSYALSVAVFGNPNVISSPWRVVGFQNSFPFASGVGPRPASSTERTSGAERN